METKTFFDCEKQNTENLTIPLLNDLSHILKSSVKPHSYLINGKRMTGKTYLIKTILSQYVENNMIDEIVLFTNKYNNNYDDIIVNNQNILKINSISDLDDHLCNIILRQLTIFDEKIIKNIFIVFDDIQNLNKVKNFSYIMFNGRHIGIYVICSNQFPLSFNPEIRINFDYFFCFKEDMLFNRRKLYDYYYGFIPSFKQFNFIMNGLDEYNCILKKYNCNELYITKSNYNKFNKIIKLSELSLSEKNRNKYNEDDNDYDNKDDNEDDNEDDNDYDNKDDNEDDDKNNNRNLIYE